jgi:hypothetical protein
LQSNSNSRMKCYYCNNYGHYKFECPKLKNKEECDKLNSSFVAGVVKGNPYSFKFKWSS